MTNQEEKQDFLITKLTNLQQTNSLLYKKFEKLYNDDFIREYIEKNIDTNFFSNIKNYLV